MWLWAWLVVTFFCAQLIGRRRSLIKTREMKPGGLLALLVLSVAIASVVIGIGSAMAAEGNGTGIAGPLGAVGLWLSLAALAELIRRGGVKSDESVASQSDAVAPAAKPEPRQIPAAPRIPRLKVRLRDDGKLQLRVDPQSAAAGQPETQVAQAMSFPAAPSQADGARTRNEAAFVAIADPMGRIEQAAQLEVEKKQTEAQPPEHLPVISGVFNRPAGPIRLGTAFADAGSHQFAASNPAAATSSLGAASGGAALAASAGFKYVPQLVQSRLVSAPASTTQEAAKVDETGKSSKIRNMRGPKAS